MKTLEMTDSNSVGYQATAESVPYESGNSRLGLGVIMALSGLVGVWGVACIVNGLAAAGSIQELGRGLITAVMGI